MPISARKMDQILAKVLGFERRMGKHQIYILRIGGRQVARTLISHGAREIGEDLMATMARQMGITLPQQMGITLSQLEKIIAGKMDREEYYRLLEEQGCIE